MGWNERIARLNRRVMRPFEETEDAAYEHPAGTPFGSVRGVFDQEHQLLEVGGSVPISTPGAPMFDVLEDSLPPGYGQGDRVIVRATLYEVVDVQPDGQGIVSLILQEE